MNVSRDQALAFVDKITGSELCRGAGEDESASYFTSPVPRAFLEGAVGAEHVINGVHYMANHRLPEKRAELKPMGEFFREVGQRFIDIADGTGP